MTAVVISFAEAKKRRDFLKAAEPLKHFIDKFVAVYHGDGSVLFEGHTYLPLEGVMTEPAALTIATALGFILEKPVKLIKTQPLGDCSVSSLFMDCEDVTYMVCVEEEQKAAH